MGVSRLRRRPNMRNLPELAPLSDSSSITTKATTFCNSGLYLHEFTSVNLQLLLAFSYCSFSSLLDLERNILSGDLSLITVTRILDNCLRLNNTATQIPAVIYTLSCQRSFRRTHTEWRTPMMLSLQSFLLSTKPRKALSLLHNG